MKSRMAGRLAPIFASAAVFAALAAPVAARADVTWLVSGLFDDGGTLSGFFNINVYGYLEGYDLTTTTGGAVSGFEYTPLNSYFSNDVFYVDAQPGYAGDLHLQFTTPLTTHSANNPIIGGEDGPSYECVQSYSCYVNQGGTTRYLTSGFASSGAVPEPGVWLLMLGGFGGVGALLRHARRKPQPVAA